MSFLAPLFLLGLGAIAIPVLIHLTHRERRDPLPFPSLMFLRKVPFKTTRRQRIRNWVLFAIRVAAIALIAAAFARPFLQDAAVGGASAGSAREVVLLLDRSYSMAFGDRWDRARRAADAEVANLGPDDRMTVVAFSDAPEALNQSTGDRAMLRAVLDRMGPGAGPTRYTPAFQLARDLLEPSRLPQREVVVVTDFQRTGWDGATDIRLPDGVTLRHVDLSSEPGGNLGITGAVLSRSPDGGGHVTTSAQIANVAADSAPDIPVRLEIDGDVVQTRSVTVPPRGAAPVTFTPIALPDRPVRGRLLLPGDALPTDDAFHFLVRPIPAIGVLVLESPSAPAAQTLYLRRALQVGRDPRIDLRIHRNAAGLSAADLADRALVILNDAPFPGGEAGRRLLAFVENGGGLLVALGPRAGGLPGALRDSVGAPAPEPVDRLRDRGGTMSITDFDHPAFAPFSRPRSGDFSAARFFRYRRLPEPPGGEVLARLDDGSPAVVETRRGTGRVTVLASGLANEWNSLPVQPVFLPLIHQFVRYLADFSEAPAWYVAGQVVDLVAAGLPPEADLVLQLPSGARRSVEHDTGRVHLPLDEAGFYVIRPLDGGVGDTVTIPVNPDIGESDLTPLDPEELLAAARPTAGGTPRDPADLATLGPVEKEARQQLWWYLLLVVVLLLGVEALVAGRATRTARGG